MKYLTYWPLFVFVLILVSGASYVYLRYTVPQYEATASIIIKDEKKGDDDSKFMESLNMINTKKIIENEVDVLQSRPVIEDVVKKLHLYAPIFHEGKVIMVSAYLDAPVTIESFNPDSIKGNREKILLKYDSRKGLVTLNNKYTYPVNEWQNTLYGKLKFVPNNKYVANFPEKSFNFSLIEPKIVTKRIQDKLSVKAVNKLSSVIDLQYRDDKPQLAEDVLNAIIESYTNIGIREKNALAANTLSIIEDRLNTVSNDLSLIQSKIQQYKANSGAVDISTQGQLFLQNVSANNQKLSDINTQLSMINQLQKQVSSNDNNTGILSSTLGVNDPTLSQLMNNFNTAQLERERLKKTVAENNPMLVSISDQISKIKRNIIDQIKDQRSSLEANKENISVTNSGYNSMLHSIPVKERELMEISRDQIIKNGIYSFLLQKREEIKLSYASTISESRVVNYSQSSNIPVSPNKMMVIGVALMGVILLPIVFINARETLNPNILYRQDIETRTSIPIIGEVAFNKSRNKLVVEPGKRSFIAEEFRKIRSSLAYLGINATHKKMLITSAISGEGKSFIAANLAISFSLTGKKVVLVDLDLHNSSLGKIFNRVGEIGVSDYLAGEEMESDIINSVPLYENLYFISGGSLEENLSELFENGRVQQLITYLDSNFDVVIIDSEPVGLVTDAHLLSGCCDATLYVIRHMYSPKMLLKRFDQNNEITPLNNPGIIFNAVRTRGYFKNNYGYGYGYVYGDKELSKMDKKKAKIKAKV